jgi:hypothetical protein
VIVEDYAPDDHDGCLEVFQTNQPLFFTPEELDLFRSFLNALPGPYLVVRDPDRRRVERITRDGSVREITLNTSQHTLGFYQRLGFEVVEVLKDGYAEGLDRCEMRLVLTEGRG